MMLGALPPRHVYSATVKNAGGAELKVAVTFTFHDDSTEIDEVTIAGGSQASFADKTKEAGSMKTIAHITSVSVSAGGKSASVSHPFNVSSPTRDYVFTVGDDLSIAH
jgi:hypothetical protein